MTEQERFEKEINKAVFEKGLDKITYSDILVSKNTPQLLINFGLDNLPILFSKKHFYKAIKPYNRKKHYKGLDLYEHIYKIPTIIKKPSIILKDIIVNNLTGEIINNLTHTGDILVCSDLIDSNGFPIILSLKANSEKGIYKDILKENYLITIFGHDNFTNLINIAINNNCIYYYNKEKAQELNRCSEKLVPQALFNLEPNIILQHFNKNVNNANNDIKLDSINNIKNENKKLLPNEKNNNIIFKFRKDKKYE